MLELCEALLFCTEYKYCNAVYCGTEYIPVYIPYCIAGPVQKYSTVRTVVLIVQLPYCRILIKKQNPSEKAVILISLMKLSELRLDLISFPNSSKIEIIWMILNRIDQFGSEKALSAELEIVTRI